MAKLLDHLFAQQATYGEDTRASDCKRHQPDHLFAQQATYGESLTFHLAAALFYTCSRFTEIASLRWSDCLLSGSGQITGLRIKAKGGAHHALKLGLRLDMRAGGVRITTAEVRPPALRNYFAALVEQRRVETGDGGTGGDQEDAGPLSTTGLEVLACIAFKQPLSLPEINGYFTSDKRLVVLRLQHLGLVDCRTANETGRTVWMTTGEFLRRFNLQSPTDLERLLAGSLAQAA